MSTPHPMTRKEMRQHEREQKMAQKQSIESKKRIKKIFIAAVVVCGTIALVIGMVILQKQTLTIVNLTQDPSKGPKEAKVLVAEYADFQCPACAANAPAIKDLIATYGDSVRFEYNDFPLPQHEYAPDAAIAAQCAFDQDKFFELHDILFKKQNEWSAALTHESAQTTMRAYAEGIGLDMAKFDTCVVSDEVAKRIDEDMTEGRKAGVNSTPSFFVNGKRIVDTPFSANVKKAIDEALAQ